MGLELVIFIAAILFGIFIYWRESNGNSAYRFVNKIVNSKALQMKANDKRGFIYKQAFIPRLIFVVSIVLIAAIIVQFLTPISIFGSYYGISAFASFAVGTLLGTYLASFVIKSTDVLEEKTEAISDVMSDVVEKGKDFIEDLKSDEDDEPKTETEVETEAKTEEAPADGKSARERLKDKGLM